MKVDDLIKELKKLPPDTVVVIVNPVNRKKELSRFDHISHYDEINKQLEIYTE